MLVKMNCANAAGGGVEFLEQGEYIALSDYDGTIYEITNNQISLTDSYGNACVANIGGLGYTSFYTNGTGNCYSYRPYCVLEDGSVVLATGTAGTGGRTFTLPNNTKYVLYLYGSTTTGGAYTTITLS